MYCAEGGTSLGEPLFANMSRAKSSIGVIDSWTDWNSIKKNDKQRKKSNYKDFSTIFARVVDEIEPARDLREAVLEISNLDSCKAQYRVWLCAWLVPTLGQLPHLQHQVFTTLEQRSHLNE
jgi:hypothetical protein